MVVVCILVSPTLFDPSTPFASQTKLELETFLYSESLLQKLGKDQKKSIKSQNCQQKANKRKAFYFTTRYNNILMDGPFDSWFPTGNDFSISRTLNFSKCRLWWSCLFWWRGSGCKMVVRCHTKLRQFMGGSKLEMAHLKCNPILTYFRWWHCDIHFPWHAVILCKQILGTVFCYG